MTCGPAGPGARNVGRRRLLTIDRFLQFNSRHRLSLGGSRWWSRQAASGMAATDLPPLCPSRRRRVPSHPMNCTRREALGWLGATAIIACSGCGGNPGLPPVRGPTDAGPLDAYSHEGVYPEFRNSRGFFVIREQNRIFAQTAICTHEACVIANVASGFRCRCHGSTFTIDGHVTNGPARRDLPRFSITTEAGGHLTVDTRRVFQPGQFDQPGAFVDLTGSTPAPDSRPAPAA